MSNTASIKQAVRQVLRDSVTLASRPEQLQDDSDLYALGLSSFDLISLLVALESRFAVEFPKALMERETFSSINAISAAVQMLKQRAFAHVD